MQKIGQAISYNLYKVVRSFSLFETNYVAMLRYAYSVDEMLMEMISTHRKSGEIFILKDYRKQGCTQGRLKVTEAPLKYIKIY